MAEKKREVKKRKEKAISYFDYNLLFLVIFLVCFGLVMLYSSSSYLCANSAKYGYDGAYYLKLQLRNYIIGVFGMVFFIAVPYRKWKNFGWLAYLVSFALCVLVIFIGSESHGQARWIYIGPIGFQPSEVAKVGVIVFLAMLLEKIPKQLKSWKNFMMMPASLWTKNMNITAVTRYHTSKNLIWIFSLHICQTTQSQK